jgi:F0F1-type ATP synthase assembly protein I
LAASISEAMRMAAQEARENRVGKTGAGTVGLQIGKWLRAQSLAGILLAAVLLPVGLVAAYSALLGSLAAFMPALFFAAFTGRKIGSDSAAFLQAAVIGEAVKLILIALICTVVFLWIEPLAAGWFFAGMIVVIMSGWIGLFAGLKSGE